MTPQLPRQSTVAQRRRAIAKLREQQTDDAIIDALDWLDDAAGADRAWLLDSLDRCTREVSELEDELAARTAEASRVDELDRQIDVIREAACRLRPLARRAITEPGTSGDQARRQLHEAIAWLAKGAPVGQDG